ncbi:hypothetical protein [Haloferula sp. BvORR071]|uniref:hypothetical protein n=1 Tax=Haloferula sp. BvORR071 TaxID=1396141 RepID=UPI0006990673|nr:hypothetical protein [Haloferula sp. BvORR071]
MKAALLPLLLLASAPAALAQTVFSSNFDDPTVPAGITAGTATLTGVQDFAGLGATGNTFGGTFLRSPTANVVSLQLSKLPAHTTVNIAFLLAAIDSLDGTGGFPSGDYFHLKLDGVTIFRESLANASPNQFQSYVPAPGAQLARHQDLGFTGPGSYYTDSAYDFGMEPALQGIPHTASSLTLEFVIEGQGVQDLGDESWAMDNLKLSLGNSTQSLGLRLNPFKVTYPNGTTPYFTGVVNGALPLANATLQASTDLGQADPWQNLITLPANANGSVSFLDVPDPSAAGARQNFYRVLVP